MDKTAECVAAGRSAGLRAPPAATIARNAILAGHIKQSFERTRASARKIAQQTALILTTCQISNSRRRYLAVGEKPRKQYRQRLPNPRALAGAGIKAPSGPLSIEMQKACQFREVRKLYSFQAITDVSRFNPEIGAEVASNIYVQRTKLAQQIARISLALTLHPSRIRAKTVAHFLGSWSLLGIIFSKNRRALFRFMHYLINPTRSALATAWVRLTVSSFLVARFR